MLENAVTPIKELWAVKDQAEQLKTHLGNDLDYNAHSNLVLSAASNYDA